MILRWVEKDEFGCEVTRNDPRLSIENAATYAKRNHKACNGTGIELWDNSFYYNSEDEKILINPRVIACNCVIKHLEKYGL